MKIALCDDDKNFSLELKSQVYNYSNLHNWESVIDTYVSGYELVNSKIKYDIIILDYQMDNLNGLKTAKLLRSGINKLTCIIFLTSYPEIAISAYDVDTYRFVVKNTLFDGLYKALDDFRNIIKFDYDISIKYNNEFITINTENIVFIEVRNKISYLHLDNGNVYQTKKSLTDLYKELPHTHFFKIHKAFIVNFMHITERGQTFVKVQNHKFELPISRNYLSKFKQTYYNYLKTNNRGS